MSKSRQLSDAINSVDISESAPADAVTLDASGNLLVGTTSTGNTDTGVEAWNDGLLQATRDGNVALRVNRKTSDGTILDIQKDGTTVGSIGVGAGGQSVYFGQGDTNLLPLDSQDAILPRGTEGASRDGAISLGTGTNRFANLYLSGGVYLGGTGAANYLDDYEEGTWTPTAVGSSTAGTGTYSVQSGRYIKIGTYVHFQLTIGWSAHTGSGTLYIYGLPFARIGGATGQSSAVLGYNNGLSYTSGNIPHLYINTAPGVSFLQTNNSGTLSNISLDTSVNELIVSGQYVTT